MGFRMNPTDVRPIAPARRLPVEESLTSAEEVAWELAAAIRVVVFADEAVVGGGILCAWAK